MISIGDRVEIVSKENTEHYFGWLDKFDKCPYGKVIGIDDIMVDIKLDIQRAEEVPYSIHIDDLKSRELEEVNE